MEEDVALGEVDSDGSADDDGESLIAAEVESVIAIDVGFADVDALESALTESEGRAEDDGMAVRLSVASLLGCDEPLASAVLIAVTLGEALAEAEKDGDDETSDEADEDGPGVLDRDGSAEEL